MYATVIASISLLVSACFSITFYKILKKRQDKMLLMFLDARAELHLLKDDLKSNGKIQ